MFNAILIEKADGGQTVAVTRLDESQLPVGDATIDVGYSTLDCKDGLAITIRSAAVRNFPRVPGIDPAGTVRESRHAAWTAGSKVLLNGRGLGEAHWVGPAKVARIKGDWLVPHPAAFTPAQAMAIIVDVYR